MRCEDLTTEQADAAEDQIAADAPLPGSAEAANDAKRFSPDDRL